MRTILQGVVCCAALAVCGSPGAQTEKLPELLLPVDAATTQRLTGPAHAGLRKQLYVAKQYRIVTVDWPLLEREDVTFAITLFDGVSLNVQAQETATALSNEYVRHWRGEIADVVPPSLRQVYESDPERKANLERFSTLELAIRTTSLDVSPLLRKELAVARAVPAAISNSPPGARSSSAGQPVVSRITAKTVAGRWIVPSLQARIVLVVIEEDPRYHVLYIEDPEKLPVGPNANVRRERFWQFSNQVEAEARQHEQADR